MEAGHVYRILITKECKKGIEKAPASIKSAVEKAFGYLSHTPSSGANIKALKGEWSGHYRYRIGSYRLIYFIDNENIYVKAIKFSSRGDVYK